MHRVGPASQFVSPGRPLEYHARQGSEGYAFIMNCQDTRESLSMLLDGGLSLTERVPLELHVNTCGECRQKLADLQMVKVVEEQAVPRPAHDWRPRFAHWRLTLAHWWLGLTHWGRATLGHWRPTLGHWRPSLGHWRPTLGHWRPTLRHLRSSLSHWRPTLGHRRPNLGHRRLTLGHWRPHVTHWRPTMATGFVGPALGAVRTDDVASRLRRFVVERLEKFPPRHLAAAAAVPLVITVAIFVFERGFPVDTSMRQRPSSAPTAMTASPLPEVAPEPITRTPRPPAPALPVRPIPPPAPAVRTPPQPAKPVPVPKATETKVVQAPTTTRNLPPPSGVKQERTVVASAKPVPARGAPASLPEAVRKDIPKTGGGSTDVAAAAARRRGAADVVGRLQVKSRSEAERDLAALLARAGGTSVSRQRGAAVTVVEASVPHASYGKFSQGLVRLGSWRIEAERSPLPDLVQVSVRLAD